MPQPFLNGQSHHIIPFTIMEFSLLSCFEDYGNKCQREKNEDHHLLSKKGSSETPVFFTINMLYVHHVSTQGCLYTSLEKLMMIQNFYAYIYIQRSISVISTLQTLPYHIFRYSCQKSRILYFRHLCYYATLNATYKATTIIF